LNPPAKNASSPCIDCASSYFFDSKPMTGTR
jgi:hypothetical protein